jgi:hypothetical protein
MEVYGGVAWRCSMEVWHGGAAPRPNPIPTPLYSAYSTTKGQGPSTTKGQGPSTGGGHVNTGHHEPGGPASSAGSRSCPRLGFSLGVGLGLRVKGQGLGLGLRVRVRVKG